MPKKEKQIKCQECGSTNVKINRRPEEEVEDGLIESVDCQDCGHHEPYFGISKRGEEVLKILLLPKDTSK